MKIRHFLCIFIILILTGNGLFAQLTVTQGAALGMTPLQLVQNVLVGQGVTISNATFNGSSAPITSNQIGSFIALNDAYTQLGLSGGLIMSSGTAAGAIGPNNTAGYTGGIPAGAGDPDLTTIAGTATHDAAVLEFDFVPVSDTLSFRYVFGSEEFFEYCNQYNDAFGFFLSGPGITGTFTNSSVDIALMPETVNYVTINNICADPSSRWTNPTGGLYYQYDGISVVLTAWHLVTPCQTYHIKLAVADAGDNAYDSGVFLEENSFTASGFTVDNTFTHPGLGQVSIEGCSDATVIFRLETTTVQNDTIFYTIGGTAINGVDYTLIPDYVVIPAGMDSTTLLISPFMDLIPEGTETVILNIPMQNCSSGTIYHDTISIFDNLPMTCHVETDTTICGGQSITLHATPTGGQTPYRYLWNTASNQPQITITPPDGVNLYWVSVMDGCSATDGDSVIVTVNPTPVITNASLISTVCTGNSTNIVLQSSVAGSTFSWTATCPNLNISGYSGSTGPLITQTLTNTGTTIDTVTYHVTATALNCPSLVKNFKVAVIPNIDAYFQPNGQSVCSGSTTAVSILSHTAGTTFSWTFTYGSANLSGASNNSGNLIAQMLSNSGFTTDTVIYHVTPSNSGCAGSIYDVKVAVFPVQDVWAVPASQAICSGTATGINLFSHVTGTTFTWTASCPSPDVGGYIPGGGNSIVQTLTNSGAASQVVTYVVVPLANGCTGTNGNILVTVNPLPVPVISGPAGICLNASGTYSTAAGMTNYQWGISAGGTITSGGTTTDNSVTVIWNTVGAQTVSVNYTDGNACTALNPTVYSITVHALPVPPVSGPAGVCLNSTSIYTTTAGMTGYTWTVSAGGTITSGAGTNIINVNWISNGLKTITLNYTDGNGCTAATPSTYGVTVNTLPVPSLSGAVSMCIGFTTTYTSDLGMTNYSWTVSAGGTITAGGGTTDNSVTVLWNTTGAQSVSVNYEAGPSCTAASPTVLNVTVHPLPVVSIAGTNILCAGTTGVTYSTQAGMTNYLWTVSAGGTITAGGTTSDNTVTVTWTTPGAQSVSVNYTDLNSCTATNPASYPVTVHPLPAPSLTGQTTMCLNTAYSYTTDPGMTNYNWTVTSGGNIIAGAGTNSITVQWITPGAQTITVNYHDANGCTAPSPTSLPVTVNPLPAPGLTGTNQICMGFSATYTTEAGNQNYLWIVSAGGMITAGGGINNNTVTVLWNGTGAQSVSVNYSFATGCTAPAPNVLNVTVHTLPVVTLGGTNALCALSSGVVYSTQPGMSNYLWNVSAGGTITAGGGTTNNTVTMTWNSPGAQSVSVNYNDANGCTALTPATWPVTVNALPVPGLTGPAAVCLNTTATYSTDAAMSGYIWTVSAGGTIVSGTGTNSIVVNWTTIGAKTITVNYTNANGCTAASATSYGVTVNTLPIPGLSGNNSVCNQSSDTYATDAGMNNYTWTVSAGGTITAGGGTNNNTVTILWNTAGAQTVSVNYTVGTGCTAPSPTVLNVTVKPRPAITNNLTAFTQCSGATTNILLTASLPGTTFGWTATGSSANVIGFSPGSGSVITQMLLNNGFNLETVTYAVTPSLNGCDGTAINFTVTVNPVADVYFTPNGQTFCSGSTTGITLQSHVALTTFTYTATGSSGNVTGFGPGNISPIAQVLTNSGAVPETVTYTVTPTYGGCTGTPSNVIINIHPKPIVTYTVCNDPVTTPMAQPFVLRGGLPLGGTYSGSGTNAGFFYPSLAGTGNHTITYSYPNTWGCSAAASQVISVINPAGFTCDNLLTDIRDNKQYPTVQLGTQCWMAANLNYGNIIASTQMQRDNCQPEKFCFNDNLADCNSFGGMYQWDEMMKYNSAAAEQGFCPPGWHVPTENEWATLFTVYISNGFAGSPLKYTGYSNFNAFLSGMRFNNVDWDFSNFAVMFWSSSAHGPSKAWAHGMNSFNPSVSYYPSSRTNAFYVRCIQD